MVKYLSLRRMVRINSKSVTLTCHLSSSKDVTFKFLNKQLSIHLTSFVEKRTRELSRCREQLMYQTLKHNLNY